MTKKELLTRLTTEGAISAVAFVPVTEVIKWVEELETTEGGISDDLINEIVKDISYNAADLIDDYDLDINYKEIEVTKEVEVTSLDLDEVELKKVIKSAIESFKG